LLLFATKVKSWWAKYLDLSLLLSIVPENMHDDLWLEIHFLEITHDKVIGMYCVSMLLTIYMFVVSAHHEQGSLLPPTILYPGITNKASWQEIKGVYPTPPRNLKASGLSTTPSL
jgi:hypothetical protein